MPVTSKMLPLGTPAPAFTLPAIDGTTVSIDDFDGAAVLVVAFLCNHCPYVRHVEDALAALAREYTDQGVAFVGICSNDAEAYPDDAPAGLAQQARRAGFTFPYLIDESQDVAHAYRAACTPDFFVFGTDRTLAYRGAMDGARPGNDVPVTGEELRGALDALLAGESPPADQRPSMGCSIKWKPGNQPEPT